jgi:hypothetical protein
MSLIPVNVYASANWIRFNSITNIIFLETLKGKYFYIYIPSIEWQSNMMSNLLKES